MEEHEYTITCMEFAYCKLISTYTVVAGSKEEALQKAERHDIVSCSAREYKEHIQSDTITPLDIADSTEHYHSEVSRDVQP